MENTRGRRNPVTFLINGIIPSEGSGAGLMFSITATDSRQLGSREDEYQINVHQRGEKKEQ